MILSINLITLASEISVDLFSSRFQ